MKTKILSILALLLTVTQGAWAQTSADKGRILAADGKMYKTVTLANKVSSARAVVAYVGDVAHYWDHCLCLALEDASGPCNWEGAKTAAGSWAGSHSITLSSTTYATSHTSWDVVSDNTSTSCQTRMEGIGHGWRIPNVTDWRYIMAAYGGPSATSPVGVAKGVYGTTVRSAINTACGNTGLSNVAYWTCSTLSGSDPAEKWGVHFQNGDNKDVFWTYPLTQAPNLRLVFAPDRALTNGYVVEYNANGGSGAPAAQSKTHGTALTLSSTVPTRDGYTFEGWATSAEGPVAYSAGGSYTTDNDIVLYAQWNAIPTYTATFATGSGDTGWTIDPASGAEGATVTVSYYGENKVKSVTVKAKPICALSAVTSAHVGKVIGADGNVYNTVAQANTATTACGVIAYVGAAGEVHSAYAAHKGIAVSLDETLLAYSTVNEDLDSPTSTFATVLAWKNGEFTTNAAVAKGTYPAFTWAAGHNTTPGRVSGASAWFLPSVGQWNLAVRGMTGSNTDLKEGSSNANSNMDRDKLNVVLNAAGASPLGVGNYMMATEYSTTEFWEYIYLGYFDHMGKSAAFAVRPIFTF